MIYKMIFDSYQTLYCVNLNEIEKNISTQF